MPVLVFANDSSRDTVIGVYYRKVLRVLSTLASCRYSGWPMSDSASDSWS